MDHSKLGTLHTVSWTNFTGEKNLIKITDYLFELDKTHIYHLGLVLGLSHHRVKEMKDSETFLDDMIAAWLQKVDQVGIPTWQRLVDALRHKRVGQTGIASEIEKDKLHKPWITAYSTLLVCYVFVIGLFCLHSLFNYSLPSSVWSLYIFSTHLGILNPQVIGLVVIL